MKVWIIEKETCYDLDKAVNNTLKSFAQRKQRVIDIKYSSMYAGQPFYDRFYTAMIIYEEPADV